MRSRLKLSGARRRRSAALAALLTMAALLGRGEALAHGGGERQLTTLPPAPPGDGAKAERLLRELADPAGGLGKVVVEPVNQAKRALSRAHGARAAGDALHARQLDALALEWAEAGRALLRAAQTEAAAAEAARRAREVETQVERARTLLEETQARRGRAAAELERAEAAARAAAAAAASAEQQRIEAATKTGVRSTRPGGAGAPTSTPKSGAAKGGSSGTTAPAAGKKGAP